MIGMVVAVVILVFMIGVLIGQSIGQHSVWKGLRRRRVIVIGNWKYTGEPR